MGLAPDAVPTAAEEDELFAHMETLKPYLRTLWDSADQSLQLLRTGEAGIGQLWNRIARDLTREDPERFVAVWTGCYYGPAYSVVMKGAPHMDRAFEYLEWYATHPEAQAEWVSVLSYGVASSEAQQYIDPASLEWLPESHMEALKTTNDRWWVDNEEELTKRYQNIMSA